MNRLTVFDVADIEWTKVRSLQRRGGNGCFAVVGLEVRDADNALTEVELYLADGVDLDKLAASLGVEVTRDAREEAPK